ncbi:aldo/keto reductase [Mycobacterium aquaticum]|uniref:Oxidoreductase n=1 Tax=Mycobacterium aquaticum TaxID=1927124 RepID=A0A1X0B0D0_9MYCO|nr:aldo/keto reductase [Mycobacterium aquaticum]ORA35665.1 oxidoreductase [Mycobacterium aquaticum]
MRYTTFGARTGLRVSELALGTANFGTSWPTGASFADAKTIFTIYAEAGGIFIDTADVYQFGQAETYLADLLGDERDNFVLASKFTQGDRPNPGVLRTGNSRKTIISAVEASLRRLRTDRLDLYWVHWPDFVTPIDEIIETLSLLITTGKILHAGFCNFPAWRVAHAVALSARSADIIAIQTEYSLAERSADRELLPMADALHLGVALYSPLGGGLLTGKYRHSSEGRLSTLGSVIQREDSDQKSAVVDAVVALATDLGCSPAQVAMAWELEHARRAATAVVPIIGPRTPAQLDDYLGGLHVTLDDAQFAHLSAVSAPHLGAPHDQAAASADANRGSTADQFLLGAPQP